jgi:hypothetical protein
MKLTTTAGFINGKGEIEQFRILVTDKNCFKVKKKLEAEINKVMDVLRKLLKKGIIKSISLPRNKKIQKEIDKMVKFKEDLKNSIEKIKEIYFK